MVDWIKAAKAHCAFVVLDNFCAGVADAAAVCPAGEILLEAFKT